LVFATDSEYVVEGATKWVRGWMRKGWKTSTGEPVKNKDLWQCLLGECERWADNGVKISFWRIPRELNKEADRRAKAAAAEKEQCAVFEDIKGFMV
jgi:ribonuclease HI